MTTAHLPRIITIMGSGETAPTMMKVHRDLIARLGADPRAVVLDTPYGFQENASELASRAQDYFARSVGHPIEVAGLPRMRDQDPVVVESGLARVRAAHYVFAGPGSPTYALRQWAGTGLVDLLADKIRSGGAVTFASAAALTLGAVTVPVYEIYKSGQDPQWLDGLNLLAAVGLHVAVIPHYDNTEGGHHDTRFCYLGERRLTMLEESLPAGTHVLGIDEHTGVILDLDADTATVVGVGGVTVRRGGESTVHPHGTTIPIDLLRDPAALPAGGAGPLPTLDADEKAAPARVVASEPDTSLAAVTTRTLTEFEDALGLRDAPNAVRAALELEAAIQEWSRDTLQSDQAEKARAALRSMILRLGEAAVGGLRSPTEVYGPLIELIMDLRARARAAKDFAISDLIRDGLAAHGVEVRDTPEGAVWVWTD